jgi:hypothetical protein
VNGVGDRTAIPFHVENTGKGSRLSNAAFVVGELGNRLEDGDHQELSIG